MHIKALELGAEPVSPDRACEFLQNIKNKKEITFLCAPGKMGADYLVELGYDYEIIGEISDSTSAADTQRISGQIRQEGAESIVFIGGDGTARDVFDALGKQIPVIAVPAGVKIYSGVFAVSAIAAAHLLDAFIEGSSFSEEEVLDINEDAYRNNRLESQLYGYLMVPKVRELLQHSKAASCADESNLLNQEDLAAWMVEKLEENVLYLLGPGSTVEAVTDNLGLGKTLLGIDALYNKQIVARDINEKNILELIKEYQICRIIITPIGGNGYIFGRGSKQFTPEVIFKIGKKNIVVLATRDKIQNLKQLRVDTGNLNTDQSLTGYLEVITGYREARMVKVVCD